MLFILCSFSNFLRPVSFCSCSLWASAGHSLKGTCTNSEPKFEADVAGWRRFRGAADVCCQEVLSPGWDINVVEQRDWWSQRFLDLVVWQDMAGGLHESLLLEPNNRTCSCSENKSCGVSLSQQCEHSLWANVLSHHPVRNVQEHWEPTVAVAGNGAQSCALPLRRGGIAVMLGANQHTSCFN